MSFLLSFITSASAQVPGFLNPSSESSIPEFIKGFYDFALIVAGVLAVGAIVVGGIMYSVSGAVDKKGLGKEIIAGALWGLLLLLGSYVILRTVNPELVNLEAPKLPEIGFEQCTEKIVKLGSGVEIELPKCGLEEWPINFETGECKCYVNSEWITLFNEFKENPEGEGEGNISCEKKEKEVGETAAKKIIELGKSFEGKLKYKLGGNVVGGTADCSSMAGYLYNCVMSISMGNSSAMMSMNTPNSLEKKTGGDLNFFKKLLPGDLIGYSASCLCGQAANCGHVMVVYKVDDSGPIEVLEQGGKCGKYGTCISGLGEQRKGKVLGNCGFMIHIKRSKPPFRDDYIEPPSIFGP